MAIASINTWLNGSLDYSEGVILFEVYGSNASLLKLFKNGKNSFTRRKLAEALREINHQETKPIESDPPKDEGTRVVEQNKGVEATAVGYQPTTKPKYTQDDFPDKFHPLFAQKRKLYTEAGFLFNRLGQHNQATRAAHLARIKEIMRDQIPRIWEQLDFYHLTGQELETPSNDLQDIVELTRQRNNARSNVSKYKGVVGKERQLKKWQSALEELDFKLGRLK